jgi:long-chain fatty acid transport protein
MKKLTHVASLALLFPTLCSVPVHGVGFRLPNQDPVAIARGNAFTATADNPSAIYYNPAGITQMEGQNIQFGLYAIAAQSNYRSPLGRKSETEFEVQGAPQLYYVFSPKEKPYSFGLGTFAPYGLGLEWPEDSGFRTLSVEGRLAYASLSPVVAYEIHPSLSLAVGPTLNVGKVRFRRGLLAPGDAFWFKGDGTDVGFSAGLLWKPHDQWSFGVSYRSATDINFNGVSKARPYSPAENTSARLDFPQFVMAGVSYRPNKDWNVEVDVDWSDWDTLDTVVFKKPSGDADFPLNFKSSFMYSLGVTRYLNHGYSVSGGYFFSENSVPNRNFNPAVPDTDQHSFSIGLAKQAKRWNWAVTYQLLTGSWRTVSNSQSTSLMTPPESADGRYKFFNNALNVSVGYRF